MKTKKLLISLSIVTTILIAFASVSFAASLYGSPAEILAGLTGKSLEEVTDAREDGQSYGEQAAAENVLEAFQDEKVLLLEDRLAALVADGRLTQAEADERIAALKDAIANCDGTGDGEGLMSGLNMRGVNGLRDGTGSADGTGTNTRSGMRGGQGTGGRMGGGLQVCDGTGIA